MNWIYLAFGLMLLFGLTGCNSVGCLLLDDGSIVAADVVAGPVAGAIVGKVVPIACDALSRRTGK